MPEVSRELRVQIGVEVSPAARTALGRQGQLVLTWLTGEQAARVRDSGVPSATSLVPLVERSRVFAVETAALLAGPTFELPVRGNEPMWPFALFDHSQSFWSSLLTGEGAHLWGVAAEPAAAGRATLELRAGKAASNAVSNTSVASSPLALASSSELRLTRFALEDGSGSAVSVYVPRSYEVEPARRYPSVYLLPGLDGDDRSRFGDRSFVDALDAFGRESGEEALLIGVSTRTPFGARYTNGRDEFATTLMQRIVPAVETRFRAASRVSKRVLAGQSTGGWNAITLALTCPGVFAAVAASAPDALDLQGWLLDAEHRIAAPWLAWMRLEDAVKGPGQMTSLAHSFAREGQAPRWPANLLTGEVDEDVLERWLEHSPLRRLETEEGRAALRALHGRLFIGVARRDEFGLCEPAQGFCERLTALEVEHTLSIEDGSHFDAQDRLATLVTSALRALHS